MAKSKKARTKAARRKAGMRAQQVQLLIALGDWDALRRALQADEISYATLRSVVSEYKAHAEEGGERAREILERLQDLGVRAGFGGRGARAPRIQFDQPISRKVQVIHRKTTGTKSYVLSGISLRPFVDPEDAAIKPLPEDLSVDITYKKKGRIEISW